MLRSAYREYEAAAEGCVLLRPGCWQFPHAVVPTMYAPALSPPPSMTYRACRRMWAGKSGWQETESKVRLIPRMDHSARRLSPAERSPPPPLYSGITRSSHG